MTLISTVSVDFIQIKIGSKEVETTEHGQLFREQCYKKGKRWCERGLANLGKERESDT